MKRVAGVGVSWMVLCVLFAGGFAPPARAQEAHRYVYVPLVDMLLDLDDPSGLPPATAINLASVIMSVDLGFTYLEGPPIPPDWLDSPSTFAATLSGMKRVDYSSHTSGVNIVWEPENVNLLGQQVPTIVYPPQTSDEEVARQFRLAGYFYYGYIYAGLDPAQFTILQTWGEVNTGKYYNAPGRRETVFWKNHAPYKVLTYDPATETDGSVARAFGIEVINEILNNASGTIPFVIEERTEHCHGPGGSLFPSGNEPVDYWTSVTGRFHKCSLQLENTSWWARFTEPRLSAYALRDPSKAICPSEQYIWYLPKVLAPLHALMTKDTGERCHDVDTIVELDSGMWWSPYGSSFYEVLQGPFADKDSTSRAWTFLHVAMNNGHRLIDTVNPVNGETQIPGIIDVEAFDPEIYPGTFEGGPKIHAYQKRLISPSVSALYKRFHDILTTAGPAQVQRMAFFRNNLGDIISNVRFYVMNPANPAKKVEINHPTLLQMIADRWDSTATYSLVPPAFLWTDLPQIDRGQLPPLVFEITCTFDTNINGGGPYVPMRIIAESYEGYYYTNYYGDPFYQVTNGITGGGGISLPLGF